MGAVLGGMLGKRRGGADEDDDEAAAAAAAAAAGDALKVSPWDAGSMKRALDEKVPGYLSDATGLAQDQTFSNRRLAIMAVSVAFGCVAQFYPVAFPGNRLLLACCVVVYFGLSAVLQYQLSWSDRDYLWSSPAGPGRPAVFVRSTVDKRSSDEVVFVVECPWQAEVGRCAVSVGGFFTENGDFSEGHAAAFARAQLAPLVAAAAAGKVKSS